MFDNISISGQLPLLMTTAPVHALPRVITTALYDVREKGFFPLNPMYKTVQGTKAMDPNALFLIQYDYLNKTPSKDEYKKLLKVGKWLYSRITLYNIHSSNPFSDWDDSENKGSKVSGLRQLFSRAGK